jgi:hypothetical protein
MGRPWSAHSKRLSVDYQLSCTHSGQQSVHLQEFEPVPLTHHGTAGSLTCASLLTTDGLVEFEVHLRTAQFRVIVVRNLRVRTLLNRQIASTERCSPGFVLQSGWKWGAKESVEARGTSTEGDNV